MTTGASEKPQNALPVFKADRSVVGDRRERWWFSAGALVSQGQTTAVVGAVWTHWLADRQVPLLVGAYDDTFALDLFHDTQRQAGGVVDDAAGAFLADCVAVLRSRGLLADCFQCTTMESVIDALLGYGPVVAGLHWRESMFQPDRDAGPPICRVAPNSPAVGGHAVLLDGLSLDLQLDGVSGFIRFKNSWGQDWGEIGLCLISIDDLEQLFDSTQSFFAVPEESPPLAEDPGSLVFPSETAAPPSRSQPRYEPVRYEQQPIGSDRYTILDTIGYGPYATAIAQGIQHHLTKPPLTIGIKAPWGAGKTSLMRMIQRRLEWPETWATVAADAKLPDVPLSGDHKHLTNGSLLRLLSGRSGRRKQRAPAGHSPAAPAETGRMRRLLSRRPRSPAQETQAMQGRAVTPAEQSPLWRPRSGSTRGCTRPANRYGRVSPARSSTRSPAGCHSATARDSG
jgi:KAP family P-loop domain